MIEKLPRFQSLSQVVGRKFSAPRSMSRGPLRCLDACRHWPLKGLHASRMPLLSLDHTNSVNTLLDENEKSRVLTVGSKTQAGWRIARALGPSGFEHQFRESRAIDEFDRMLGGELLGRERERARCDEEPLMAVCVMNGSQEFLQDRGATTDCR